ncbi:MAG: M23 family metallopeptidase [Desulfobacteraceae bacterium]|nr:MAG: M23 family metallopeptidase [Desulfobacteraceae bacterium]
MLPWCLAFLFLWVGGAGAAGSSPEILFSSPSAYQGDVVLLKVRVGKGETPMISWLEREIPMVPLGKGEWYGFVGIDLNCEPGGYPLKISAMPSGLEKGVRIKVESKDYGERRLTLPREMVELDEATLKRVRKESAAINAVLETSSAEPFWKGAFHAPVDGELSGTFGRRSFINGEARSPHSGVDLKADQGVPVKAMNSGRVVLTADRFFSGLSVVVDHGGGIHSMYFHLEKILVKEKQQVAKGEIIGRVGSTGRSTGPHLHLGVRVNGARVDPLRLIGLSKELE